VFLLGSFFSAFSGVIDEAQQSLIELNNLTTTYLNYTFDPTLNQSGTFVSKLFFKENNQRDIKQLACHSWLMKSDLILHFMLSNC
jgi:hypothetical protein